MWPSAATTSSVARGQRSLRLKGAHPSREALSPMGRWMGRVESALNKQDNYATLVAGVVVTH